MDGDEDDDDVEANGGDDDANVALIDVSSERMKVTFSSVSSPLGLGTTVVNTLVEGKRLPIDLSITPPYIEILFMCR